MAKNPDCLAFPVGTFPTDNQGEPNAVGQTVTIPLSNPQGYEVRVKFESQVATGKALDLAQQQNPGAVTCAIEENVPVFQALGAVPRRKRVGQPCYKCGHYVECTFRKTTP